MSNSTMENADKYIEYCDVCEGKCNAARHAAYMSAFIEWNNALIAQMANDKKNGN